MHDILVPAYNLHQVNECTSELLYIYLTYYTCGFYGHAQLVRYGVI